MSMFSIYDSTVNSLYLAFYGRPADPSGLKFWSKALADNNGNADTIIQAFAASQEAQTRFGSDTASARITDIYQQLFNRAPDAAGLAFWTNAVEQGSATLAEVSLAILKGAQSSDLDLSTLRQKAADAFTAAVEDGSTEYSGYASIEAARVLVRAVTTDATDADLAKLVKAAVSFADTATKNPKVVEAIATGSTLLNLYDSARGLKDPVALTQALADTAKAAAGDPVTLESLLRGGGMDKVLKVMPTKATLTDVVEALAKGGLPAAVDVVYPPAKPTPAPSTPMELRYDSVSQGEFDLDKTDNITNVKQATVKFSYTGSDLKAGQKFEFSTDGVHWSSDKIKVDVLTNVVTISDVLLSGKEVSHITTLDSSLQLISPPQANVKTQVYLRAVDAATSVFAKAGSEVEYDGSAPYGHVVFRGIDQGNPNADMVQLSARFELLGAAPDALVQWRIKGSEGQWKLAAVNQDNTFALKGINFALAGQSVEVRVIDAAGNIGEQITQSVALPTTPPVEQKLMTGVGPNGLLVGGNLDGELQIVSGANTFALKLPEGANSSSVRIGAQDEIRMGTLQLKLADGSLVKSDMGQIALGTNRSGEGDILSGQYVWGFDGDDVITGTDDGDMLWGGAGNDTIIGGAGRDRIMGGAGGDTIILTGNLEDDGDTLVYDNSDGILPVFVNGGSTVDIDKIIGFGVNDLIQINGALGPVPTLRTTYLNAESSGNEYAVVRGSNTSGHFVAGSGTDDNDYMVQWMGSGAFSAVVNSIILQDFGTTAPRFTSDNGFVLRVDQSVVPPVQQPVASDYLRTEFDLAHFPALATIFGSSGAVNGVSNAGTFFLSDYTSLFSTPLAGYEQPLSGIGTNGSTSLSFKGALDASIYKMSWGDDTFTTTNGTLKAGSAYFAGGDDGVFAHKGFELAGAPINVSFGQTSGNDVDVNDAYLVSQMDAIVQTGGGNDVVAKLGGGTLRLNYDVLDNDAQDLVLGFQNQDRVQLLDGLAKSIDRDGSGNINWTTGNVIGAGTEAVVVSLFDTYEVGSNADLSLLAKDIGRQIDVSGLAMHDHLLILANGMASNSSVLLVYEHDAGSQVSAQQLTTIATFFNGALSTENIDVIGSHSQDI